MPPPLRASFPTTSAEVVCVDTDDLLSLINDQIRTIPGVKDVEVITYLKGRGIGILITDHNVRETLDIIDRASIIHAGEVLFEGAPDEILADPEVRRVYLGDTFG